jgi:hypothetical protein
MVALRQPACGPEQPARLAPGDRGYARGGALEVSRHLVGRDEHETPRPAVEPMACLSSAMRLTIGAVASVMCSSMRKNVASTSAAHSGRHRT